MSMPISIKIPGEYFVGFINLFANSVDVQCVKKYSLKRKNELDRLLKTIIKLE